MLRTGATSMNEERLVPNDVTQLLLAWSHGDHAALDALTPLIYQELHRLAHSHLRRERGKHTLQPTALIHEAYLRMVRQTMPEFESRTHFFGVATHYMRQILSIMRARDTPRNVAAATASYRSTRRPLCPQNVRRIS